MKGIITACALAVSAWAQAAGWHATTCGFTAATATQQDITVEWFTPRAVHIVKAPQGKTPRASLAVIAKPAPCAQVTKQQGATITTATSCLTVALDTSTGRCSFTTADSATLLAEQGPATFTPRTDAGKPTFAVAQAFDVPKTQDLYGLGQWQDGELSRRNTSRTLAQNNSEDFSPFVQSTAGWGLYWDNYSATRYTDQGGTTTFSSEVGDVVDYYLVFGGNADGVIALTRTLTGTVPMMPLWSYGFMQSKERYKTQYESVDVLRRYRKLGIPVDCMIQDWQYWGDNTHWNAMEFLNPKFPEPRAMVDSIHAMNAHMMISIWSSFGPKTKPYAALDSIGALWHFQTWPQSALEEWPPRMDHPSGVSVYDCYNDKARDIYWHYLDRGLRSTGIDGWWMDSTEPDHFNQKPEDFDNLTPLGTYRSLRNAYPLMTVGGVYTHQRQATDERTIVLTRSGYLGQQRYAANVWSGDITSSWQTLRRQITAGLNWQLTAMPHWNNDLGGFFCGKYNKQGMPAYLNPDYRELYVRWMQFGVFTPMMRSHGADAPRELFLYGKQGEPVYDALVEAVKLRYTLLPYIYSTAAEVSFENGTFMRALPMDFPGDTTAVKTEYMFGRALLVAPVLHAQYTPEQADRVLAENEGWNKQAQEAAQNKYVDWHATHTTSVFLPKGLWWSFFQPRSIQGGQTITVPTTLATIPLYVRAGSIVPIGPDVQYTTERPWDNLEIRLYPGADGSFTLYEDDGHTYAYERGEATRIPFKWNDAKRTLTIDERQGAFPTMLTTRNFRITLPDGKTRTVTYNGKAMKVKM